MSLTKTVGFFAVTTLAVGGAAFGAEQNNETLAQIAELKAEIAQLKGAQGGQWLTEQRAAEIRGIVTDVLADSETPGLGTRVCDVKSDRTWWAVLTGPAAAKETDATPEFLRQFQDRPCDKLVLKPALPDGVQAITGATVSSRAVLNAARNAVERVRAAAGADAPQPPAPAKPKSADAVSGATSYAAPAASPTSTLPGARPKP